MEAAQFSADDAAIYVIKPSDLGCLNYLAANHPRPRKVEWINRGNNQRLQPASISQLLRTLQNDTASPSVVKLHRSAGLRITFNSLKDRNEFVKAFGTAKTQREEMLPYIVSYLFKTRDGAEDAIIRLKENGIPPQSISLLWRSAVFASNDTRWLPGHSKLSVASAIAASGLAGSLIGFATVALPGIGTALAFGLFAATHLSSMAAAGGAIGATGAAIAMMLSDPDVDDVSDAYHKQHSSNELLIVAVDTRLAEGCGKLASSTLSECGGHVYRL